MCFCVPKDVALDLAGVLTTVSDHIPVTKKVSGHVQSEIKAAATPTVQVQAWSPELQSSTSTSSSSVWYMSRVKKGTKNTSQNEKEMRVSCVELLHCWRHSRCLDSVTDQLKF